MIDKDKINFHDSTIIKFFKENNCVIIRCEDVDVEGHGDGDGIKETVEVKLESVLKIEMDDQLIDPYEMMLEDDGEVLGLKFLNNGIEIVVEWNDFESRKSYIRGYTIIGDVSLRCLD